MDNMVIFLLSLVFIVLLGLIGVVIWLAVHMPRQSSGEQMANLSGKIDAIQKQVESNLQAVTDQVKIFGDVKQTLGKVTEATDRVLKLGEDVSKLGAILDAPNRRGGFGEILLDNLLYQALPGKYYQLQYAFRDNTRVDAAILLGEKILPIDAKFPMENFEEKPSPEGEVQPKSRGNFGRAVKGRIDETAEYIRPDEKTFEFAMMYIPAENIYYEVVSNADLFNYAMQRHVIPVSPNSFFAYLQVVVYGLRGMQIEENARIILNRLSTLKLSLGEVERNYDTLGTHITNTQSKYNDLGKKLGRFSSQLSDVVVEVLPDDTNPTALPKSED